MMTFYVRCVYLLAAAVCLSSLFVGESDAALSVVASFNDTRCGDGRVVCPDDPLLFTCTVTDSTSPLTTVRLPSGQQVNVDNENSILMGSGDLPAGVAVQSHDVTVGDSPWNYTLSLAFERASLLTGSVICDARSSTPDQQEVKTCPIANGPAPPEGLAQNESFNTESSAVVQWRAPDTGGSGVNISRYTVTVEGQMPVDVSGDGRDVLTHTTSVPKFNTSYSVSVTAINFCDLSSQPATTSVFIEARVPPQPIIVSVVLECDAPLNAGRAITISWMNGGREDEVIYPGEENATVVLTPGGTGCSDVPGTSCAANITSDGNYTASLTLRNSVGLSAPVANSFNSTPLSAEKNHILESPSVRISLNVLCNSNITYEINVLFGVQMENEENCQYQKNITRVVSPVVGNDSLNFPVEFGKTFCYKAILKADSEPVFEISDSSNATPPTEPPTTPDSVPIIVGCVVAAALVGAVAVALIAVICFAKRNRDKGKSQQAIPLSATTGPGSPDPDSAEAGPMYQEPNTISRSAHPETGELYTDINLKTKRSEQDPSSIEHQEGPSGDVYAMPQKKTGKKEKKEKNEEPEEEGLTEEEKAALYSVPDRKTQKAKSAGLTYADVVIQPSSKPAPPPQGSAYADIKYN